MPPPPPPLATRVCGLRSVVQGKGNKLMDQIFETFMNELRAEKGPEEDTVTGLCQGDPSAVRAGRQGSAGKWLALSFEEGTLVTLLPSLEMTPCAP